MITTRFNPEFILKHDKTYSVFNGGKYIGEVRKDSDGFWRIKPIVATDFYGESFHTRKSAMHMLMFWVI